MSRNGAVRFDGSPSLPRDSGSLVGATGLFGTSGTDVWAIEDSLSGIGVMRVVGRKYWHFDGQAWSVAHELQYIGPNGHEDGRVVSESGAPLPAALVPWARAPWTAQATPGAALGTSVACGVGCEVRAASPSGTLFSAGAGGRLYRGVGDNKTELGHVVTGGVLALSVRSPADVWVLWDEAPQVRHFDGKTWSSLPALDAMAAPPVAPFIAQTYLRGSKPRLISSAGEN
jgi:hypothetical protein